MKRFQKKINIIQSPVNISGLLRIVILAILGGLILFAPGQNIYTAAFTAELKTDISRPAVDMPEPASIPVNISAVMPDEVISATAVVVLDVNSGIRMYSRNADLVLSPASTTKILTALVILDKYNLDDVITVKTVISEGQLMDLVPGEKMTVENLLYGLLIQSGNDAAYTLAENYPGGVAEFVRAMNEKAKKIGLKHSSFTNPMGFDDPNHKVTALDLSLLARYALQNRIIAKIVAIPQITISDVTHTYFHNLANVNELLGKIPGVGGIKTGWTEEAGENLVTLVDRNGHKIILVVLHSANRFSDTENLINWIFNNISWKSPAEVK